MDRIRDSAGWEQDGEDALPVYLEAGRRIDGGVVRQRSVIGDGEVDHLRRLFHAVFHLHKDRLGDIAGIVRAAERLQGGRHFLAGRGSGWLLGGGRAAGRQKKERERGALAKGLSSS